MALIEAFNEGNSADRRPVKTLYEDGCYIAFNKPEMLLVIPPPKKEIHTLTSIVNSEYAKRGCFERLHPCHRLDRETSGVILFAKGKKNQQLMMEEFRRRRVKKKYIAFIQGRPKTEDGTLKSAISDFDQKRFNKKTKDRLAITCYKVVETRQFFSIIEVYPLTGRTNQIRIQFSQAGFPLLGDRKYARGRDFKIKFRRTALHASQLEWYHPVEHKRIVVTAPLPKDMEEFLVKN